jgi:hypothetical protein
MTEITFPTLDAGSKDAGGMIIKISPEYTRRDKGEGSSVKSKIRPQSSWGVRNYRLKIDGLEDACRHVNHIESLSIRSKVVENAVGEMRDYEKFSSNIEFPHLVITFSSQHADLFYKWHEDFVIKGNNTPDREKNGTLDFLAPNLATDLFSLHFSGLGIFKMTGAKGESHSEQISREKAEMYCQGIRFSTSCGATG